MTTNHKLIQACTSLGINLLEISKFVQVNDIVEIAAWGYEIRTGKNYIFINPRVLKLPVEMIRIILKHEILHYAGYREIPTSRDRQLSNICLDIVINKILHIMHQTEMTKLCRKIYPDTSKQTVICLARSDIAVSEVPISLKDLWREIWEQRELPSPASLYFRLLPHTDAVQKITILMGIAGTNPFSGKNTDDVVLRSIPTEPRDKNGNGKEDGLEQLAQDIVSAFCNSAPKSFSKQLSRIFSSLPVGKEECDIEHVGNFIRHLKTKQQLDRTANTILDTLNGSSRLQVYPYRLSRLGLVYLSCGISRVLPLYWNRFPETGKPKLAVYIDTSPSMDVFKEMEVFLVDELKDSFPTRIFLFAGDIKEVDVRDFTAGKYEQGSSTDFDAPLEHLAVSEFDAGIVFTDGCSSVSKETEVRLKERAKRLFTVYFTQNGTPSSELDPLSEEVLTVRKE